MYKEFKHIILVCKGFLIPLLDKEVKEMREMKREDIIKQDMMLFLQEILRGVCVGNWNTLYCVS